MAAGSWMHGPSALPQEWIKDLRSPKPGMLKHSGSVAKGGNVLTPRGPGHVTLTPGFTLAQHSALLPRDACEHGGSP